MIVTITPNPSFDRSVTVENLRTGEVNRAIDSRLDAGGKGVNVSKLLNVLGNDNIATGFAGKDNFDLYSKLLKSYSIHSDFVITDGCIRTNTKLSDIHTGETTDINESGFPIGRYELEKLKALLTKYLDDSSITVISGSLCAGSYPNTISEIIEHCTIIGSKVIVDTSGDALKQACVSRPYLVKPNIDELSALTGRSFSGLDQILFAARELVNSGIHTVAVSMGSNGLLYVTSETALYSPGIQVDVKCTVGAGDAVTAALAYAIEHDLDDVSAIRLAAASGTATVTTPGSMSPTMEMIQNYIDKVEIKAL